MEIELSMLFCYLHGTIDMGSFCSSKSKPEIVGYADAWYLPDPLKARFQHVNYSSVAIIYHDDVQNKPWLTLLQIILNYLQSMGQVKNVYRWGQQFNIFERRGFSSGKESHFFKSYWTTCNQWGKSKIFIAQVNNLTYSRAVAFLLAKKFRQHA